MKLKLLPGILVLLLATSGPVSADTESHQKAVERLFELTGMQKMINDSVDNVLALQLAQSPELLDYKQGVKEFLERHIGWFSLHDALVDMYVNEFSESEIKEMNAFYATPVGQKVITRLPVLVQQRNQIASQRLQQNIGELQHLLSVKKDK